MINIKQLTEKDIGRRVVCSMCKGIENFGRIKTWDDNFIYVIFDDWGCSEGIFDSENAKRITEETALKILNLKG